MDQGSRVVDALSMCVFVNSCVNTNSQPSMYQIAREQRQHGLAGQLRSTIVELAVTDPSWCLSYDKLLDYLRDTGMSLRHPEAISMNQSTVSYRPVFISDFLISPSQASLVLRSQASHLGAEDSLARDLDLVAAVIGAEIWMAALDKDSLAYAASQGPDASSSAAAILARVCGSGIETMPIDPDWPSLRFPMEHVLEALSHARSWCDCVLGKESWAEVARRVVTDLGYFALGGTKTHDASLLLGVRMLDIKPLT